MRIFAILVLSAASCKSNAPRQSESKIEKLGSLIFMDESLSEPAGQACGSCHLPGLRFTGNDRSSVIAVANNARLDDFGIRNVPTVSYAKFIPPFQFIVDDGERIPMGGLFWDGRSANLEEQAVEPFYNRREMGNPAGDSVAKKIEAAPYAPLFKEVFGKQIFDTPDVAFKSANKALAAFQRSSIVNPFSSKFDQYLRGKSSLSDLEQKGFELFKDKEKGNCLACHVGDENSRDPEKWLFTDFTYDNIGVPRNRLIPANKDNAHFDLGLCASELTRDYPELKDKKYCGAFRVPTLRNVAVTSPYMHNGVFITLKDAVTFYSTRDTDSRRWYPNGIYDDAPEEYHGSVNRDEPPYDRKPGQAPRLTADEIEAIVAFLETLTDQ